MIASQHSLTDPAFAQVRESLNKVIDYLYKDEEDDYESLPVDDHIFLHVRRVADWLNWLDYESGQG